LIESDASCGVYKVPISINYSDYSGNEYEKNYYATIIVGAEPKLELSVESSEILKVGDAGNVVISVANMGLTDVKFLNVLVNNSENVKVLSPSNIFYIGSLDSDDYETFEVKLWVTGGRDLYLEIIAIILILIFSYFVYRRIRK
jgi:hypothetical protein